MRLVGRNGKVANFPRSWAKFALSDGREGVEWIEWNLNHASADFARTV
jgi:hypothetical protein